ncbi:MAG: glycosyltransferase family 4 protein [Coriobacteriia bacterium]|nr:glycosyltransferase family 4 protein [Coriobacteriia bacterium]
MVSVFFILDEAYSLFPGGEDGPRFGGAGLQMYLLADELSKDSELDVHWMFLSASARHPVVDVMSISHPRIALSHIPRNRTVPFGHVFMKWAWENKMRSRYDSPHPIVLIASTAVYASCLLEQAEYARAKTILRLSSDTDTTNPRWSQRSREEAFSLYRAIDQIVTQTRTQHDLLFKNVFIESTRIGSIWPLPKDGIFLEREHILWVASAQALKQPWIFFNLAKQFPSERFVMVMPVTSEVQLAEYVIRQASSVDNLTVIDEQVPLDELVEYFAKAKVFVNTSEIEGFPNTFLQAGAVRTPILSFGINPDDMLNVHKMGICADGDVERFTEGLTTLLGDASLRDEYGENGFNYVKQFHNPTLIASQWKAIIQGVLDGR